MSQNQVRRHSDPKLWCPLLSTFHTKRVLQALGKLVLDYQHDHNHIIIWCNIIQGALKNPFGGHIQIQDCSDTFDDKNSN